jgi:hypothetical protein
MNLSSIQADISRLIKMMQHPPYPDAAYVLAYSSAKGDKRMATLRNRFTKWENATGWKIRGSVVYDDPSDEEWAWGIVMLRHKARG